MRIHNTLTRRLEELVPGEPGHVRMYTCGPTVYDHAHIGNFRTYVWEDLLRRTLELAGFRVTQVMNLTDVEDKIIARMEADGLTLAAATEPYVLSFFEDLDTLGIRRAEHYPRATTHIAEMIELAQRLEQRGMTYSSKGSLYYRIDAFAAYGRLSNLEGRQVLSGARVDHDEYDKDDARDFVLWKAERPGEPAWDSPFGRGRPGWHLECSAMSMKYLGESFDLHTGGVDNIFPHHENEIAQSEAATGCTFVKYWMHAAHLLVDGEKMSKSKGNVHTLRELLAQGHAARAVRLLLLATHYRSPLNFTQAGMAQATSELERLDGLASRLSREPEAPGENREFDARVAQAAREFEEALFDDLNISGALGALFRLVRETHVALDRAELPADSRARLRQTLGRFDSVLGLAGRADEVLEPEIEALIEKRRAARAAGDWAAADGIRQELAARGILLEDTPGGTVWRRKLAGVR
jgi:cysteinyl-tRNA synthetase